MIDTVIYIIPQSRKGYQLMTTILVAGYQNSDLGIFSDKDPKIEIIRKAIRKHLVSFLEDGVTWFILMGNLGFEFWVLEEIKALKKEGYECNIATVLCFETHGQHWNDLNQEKLAQFKQVDFLKTCFTAYEHPGQFKAYHDFLLVNSDGAFVFYDEEHPTKFSFLYQKMTQHKNYSITVLNYDELNDIASEMD